MITAGEKRADRAARARIRYEMTQAFGDRVAYSSNLYHRHDGWYYQKARGHMEHLGHTLAQVTAELRQIGRTRRDADRYDNYDIWD